MPKKQSKVPANRGDFGHLREEKFSVEKAGDLGNEIACICKRNWRIGYWSRPSSITDGPISCMLCASPMAHKEFLAHLGGRLGRQTLLDHLLGVSSHARRNANKLGLSDAGELIGLLHDAGKATDYFLDYILSFEEGSGRTPLTHLRGKIDHSTAGAQCIQKYMPEAKGNGAESLVALLLGLCIASHHSGLIDCLKPDGTDALTLRLKYEEEHTRATEAWSNLPIEVQQRCQQIFHGSELMQQCGLKIKSTLRQRGEDANVQVGLLARMLFSCLIDADRSDTADHEKPHNAQHRQEGKYEGWQILRKRLDARLATFSHEGFVNQVRARVSEECFQAATRPRGAYTLTVPTGGGKTLAALRFALAHAEEHKLDRVFFISPYISIVDQNAAVTRSILEPSGVPYASVVLEHHSNLTSDRRNGENETESDVNGWRRRVLAENWDSPVVFTTMVQVLEALFGEGTSSVRRLHAMARSVMVFDEIQTLPVKLVHLFNHALNFLTEQCGATVLLCTATQPLLGEVDKKKGAVRLAENPELMSDVSTLRHDLRRYTVQDETRHRWTQDELAARIVQEADDSGSCLAIVNTRRDALELYKLCRERLQDRSTLVHLSTSMCPAHRVESLDFLKKALAHATTEATVICISTQLIEAGVDIDFATVIRDLAGLDSLAQAAGRCNRNGLLPQPGRVILVALPDPSRKLEDIVKGRDVSRIVLDRWQREHPDEAPPLDSSELMHQFYEQYFFNRSGDMSYPIKSSDLSSDATMLDLLGTNETTWKGRLRKNSLPPRSMLLQSFTTAAKAFELIDQTMSLLVPYRAEGRKIIAEICSAQDLALEWQLLRKAQQFSLSVRAHEFRTLDNAGAIHRVEGTDVCVLQESFYDPEFGLRFEAGALESLIG